MENAETGLTRTAARIYGTLSGLGGDSSDVLSRLLPFFEPILRTEQGKRFLPDAFADAVRSRYRWNFNTDIVEVFTPRLEELGWVTRSSESAEASSYIVTLPQAIVDTEVESTASRELREQAEAFKSFAEALSPLTAIPLNVSEFEEMLIEWLLYVEAYNDDVTNFTVSHRKDESGIIRQFIDIPDTSPLNDEQRFLCARYVDHAIKNDQAASNILARIASIGLLTEVVQDFVKPTTSICRTRLIVYLDSPVVLELLGVSGNAARANIKPIISELQRIGADVRVFVQSVDELKNSLGAVLASANSFGPTARAIARGEVMRDYVQKISENPEPFLEAEGIQVAVRTIEQTPSTHVYFDEERRRDLYSALNFQLNPSAREHDADVTTLVMRQRQGRSHADLFKSQVVMLTSNGVFTQVVRKYCVRNGVYSKNSVPPVVHRRVFAATMWLRTGLGSEDLEVPKRMLLANCEAVLAIRPGIVRAAKVATDALGDTEKARQLDLLISQPRSAQMLMDKTLGATGVVTPENMDQLFQEMLHPHLEEERGKAAEAIKEERRKAKQRQDRLSKELEAQAVAAVEEERRKADQEAAKLEKRLEDESIARKERESQLKAQLQEDLSVVNALASEVSDDMRRSRTSRKIIAVIITALFCAPPLFIGESWAWVPVILGVPLAYLTITGSRFIGIATSETSASKALKEKAKARLMSTKLTRFHFQWNGKAFDIAPISTDQADVYDET